jgi:type VI secretion system protein ImpB
MPSRGKNAGSVAPKERINISYKPAAGNAKERVELPFKLLVLGDFTQQSDERTVEDRSLLNVNRHNFNEVMKDMDLTLNLSVANKMREGGDEQVSIELKIDSLDDFEPDNIISQVEELKQVMELREALKSLKGPLGNSPQMRKQIQALLTDSDARAALRKEIGLAS